jgi:hypothetical protein
MAAYTIDEYLKLGKTTVKDYLEYYCSSIIECFGEEFLRHSTVADTQLLLAKSEEHQFPGYVREHRLYTLTVTQLSSRLVRPIYMMRHQTSYSHP